MTVLWKREPAGHGSGIWLVGVEDARVNVIAPPGVPVSRPGEREAEFSAGAPGWRWATWARLDDVHWPLIDRKAPDAMREIDTREVLLLLSDDLHEFVWGSLLLQVQIARRFGCPNADHAPSEDLARAGAASATWLVEEMSRAFPERAGELMSPVWAMQALDVDAPKDLGELAELGHWSTRTDPAPSHRDATRRGLLAEWLSRRLGLHWSLGWLGIAMFPCDTGDGCHPALPTGLRSESLRRYDWGRDGGGVGPESGELACH